MLMSWKTEPADGEETWEDIERELGALRERLRHSWTWYQRRREALIGRPDARVDLRRLETLWQRALAGFLAEIEALNRRIDAHNRALTSQGDPWPRLDLTSELSRLGIGESEPGAVGERLETPSPVPPISEESPAEVALHRIITLREKIPHTPRWEQARKRALWRYLARVQSHRREDPS